MESGELKKDATAAWAMATSWVTVERRDKRIGR
jgi:hypothetical protein